jgi:hypothetical protein
MQCDARLVAKDMENDALSEKLREVLEENARLTEMVLQEAGLEGAEAQAGFGERAGFAVAAEGARGEAAVGGGDQGGGGEKRLVGAEEEDGERAEGRSAAQDGGGGEASVARVATAAQAGGRQVEGAGDGAEEGAGGSGGQGGEEGEGGREVAVWEGEEGGEQSQRKLEDGAVATSGIRAAVDAAAAGAVTLWEAGTGVLAQTWSGVLGWGDSSGEFFRGKAGTLQCTDVVAKCTIDAQASSSDVRRVLYVKNADGVYLTGLIVRGGYREVSRGDAVLLRGTQTHAPNSPALLSHPPPHPNPPPLRIPNPYPLQGMVSSEAGGGGWGVLWRGDLLARSLFQPTN